jgi:hypothetical protein
MRRTVAISSVALLLLAPSRGSAQTLQSFEDLALRVNLDDRLRVEDQSGVEASGRLTRLTREEIAIQTGAGERRFTSDEVREVAVRGHSLRRSALIGAGVFAVLGAVATCSHEGGKNCLVIGPLGAAPIGVGVGLAMGALISRTRTVYRAPEGRASVPRPPAAGGVPASLLEDLGLRVNLDDQLRVEDQSGVRTTGRLTRLSADAIVIHTGTGDRQFTRDTVRQVAVRRRPIRMAVLIGAGAGTVAGAVAACTGAEREECADASIMAGALGAGLGLAAGALIHTTTVVFPEAETRTHVLPRMTRDAVGLLVSRSW